MHFYVNTSIYHHGIKGQKWGVRNGPPYPIEDKALKKGTKINSVSGDYVNSDSYRNNGRWMYTYRKDDDWDNKVYKGPFAKYLVIYRGKQFVKEHEFETVKDLKMPTKKERFEEFKNLYNDPKFGKTIKKELNRMKREIIALRAGSDEDMRAYSDFNPNNCKTPEDFKVAYKVFNHLMEEIHTSKSATEYAKRISRKYDAMVDDNNQGEYNDAHDPIIIFRAHEALKNIGDPKHPHYLTYEEIVNNYNDVEVELKKKGQEIFL